jgi:hypothetical protein
MLIECSFTNASDFARERVVFLPGMRIMIDSDNRLFAVTWDESPNQPAASLARLHTAMHDSEFRIHLDRDGWLITMARCPPLQWIIWFIGLNKWQGHHIYSKICILQRAFRRRFMRRRLCVDMVFSKAAAARRSLANRLHGDVMGMIISYCTEIQFRKRSPDSPLRWNKPIRDGGIFD